MEQTAANLAWGGQFKKFKIASAQSLGGLETNISVYLPPAAANGNKVPVLYYLAGKWAWLHGDLIDGLDKLTLR